MGNVFPVAPGMTSIGASGYIPTVYSGKIEALLYERTCLYEIANTEHEKEITAFGDTVIIRADPEVTIIDDEPDGATGNFETPQVDSQSLLIDKSQSWRFQTGMVQAKQTDIKNYQNRWMNVATRKLKIRTEQRVFAYMVGEAAAANAGALSGAISADIELGTSGGTAVSIDKTNVVEQFANWEQILDEQNVDPEGRWAIIPAWLANRIRISDLKDAALTGDGQSILRSPNGRLGMLCGFTLYQSNLLPTTTDSVAAACTYIPFGNKSALTFASQITYNENVKDPYTMGTTLWKGKFVYGRKVVRPEALGVCVAKKG
jgi:hypothetical protein